MKLNIVPFESYHLTWLIMQRPAVGGFGPMITDDVLRALEGKSWTAMLGDDPVACGGLIEQWPFRHAGWVYLPKEAAPYMRTITLAAMEKMAEVKGRIEMTVRKDFKAGHKWARMLGFVVETPTLHAYGPEGEDHVGYWRYN